MVYEREILNSARDLWYQFLKNEILDKNNEIKIASSKNNNEEKEEITLQASLNDRSKYESILKNLSVGEILKFELEEKNTKINFYIRKYLFRKKSR